MVEDVAKTAWLARQLGAIKRMEFGNSKSGGTRYHSSMASEGLGLRALSFEAWS